MDTEKEDNLAIERGLRRLKREERRAREAVREYVRSGEHLVEAPGKIKFYLSGAFYYLLPMSKRTQAVMIDEFRTLLDTKES